MRTFLVIVVVAVLGWLFLTQKRQEQQNVTTAPNAPAQAASPRPVSEHNWAKHALDKTNKVTRQVAEQRQSDGSR